MIRNLLATTAIATLLSSGAMAQDAAPADPTMGNQGDPAATDQQQQMTVHAEGHLASNLIGESVYNNTSEDAENIGDVTDLVIDEEGNVQAIVVGVGGFLGIGQKEVALEYDLIQWSQQQDGERYIVVETTADALEAQQEFDRAAYRPMPADADVAQTQPATQEDLASAPAQEDGSEQAMDDTAMAPADDQSGDMAMTTDQSADSEGTDTTAMAPAEGEDSSDMAAAPTDQNTDTTVVVPTDDQSDSTAAAPEVSDQTTAATDAEQEEFTGESETTTTAEDRQDRPAGETTAETQDQAATDQTQTAAIDRNQLQEAGPDQIRAENLTGANVYGANEEDIGEVGDVVLSPDGQVDAVIVDVGGFLGIGSKEVAVGLDSVSFMTDDNGDLYLYTEYTQEELEAQPEYDEATYAEQRDDQRLQ